MDFDNVVLENETRELCSNWRSKQDATKSDKGSNAYHPNFAYIRRLLESAKFNKGKSKLYIGVAVNLVAFACKTSFEKGYDGLQRHNLLTIINKLWEQNFLVVTECLSTPRSFP